MSVSDVALSLALRHPESFERQLGDRVTKRLKSQRDRRSALFRHRGGHVSAETELRKLLDERIVVLDCSWGVLIQREVRGEEAYRCERFRDHPRDVAGNPDLL